MPGKVHLWKEPSALLHADHSSFFTDDETERKKKKKERSMGEGAGLTPGSRSNLGFQSADRVKQITIANQPAGSYASIDNTAVETKVVGMSY